jgi:1,4-alpha-glucan branching enzyme
MAPSHRSSPVTATAPHRFFSGHGAAILRLVLVLVCSASAARADDPLGPTLHADGSTTFRVWAPFVDSVAVKINDGAAIPMVQEPNHPDAADTTWAVTVPGAKAGDHYRYVITANGATHEYNDPRALQLTGFDRVEFDDQKHQKLDQVQSVIVDKGPPLPDFTEPSFNQMVIYELHIGTFGGTFQEAINHLNYLQGLGINAVEVLPIAQNPLFQDHTPPDYDWGYDPAQLFAIKAKYGTPADFKEFVKQCHQRHMAVIVDVVYNHMVDNNVLKGFGGANLSGVPSGIFFYGDPARAWTRNFGPRPDFGRPQVRQYIQDNALMLLRDYSVDGLRFDDTVDTRSYTDGSGQHNIQDGGDLMRQINLAYRTTDPEQPAKITIAEDLQAYEEITNKADPDAFGFNSQWDNDFWSAVRGAVTQIDDANRDLNAVSALLQRTFSGDMCCRVIFTEDHDKVGHPENGESRLPRLIDTGNNESVFAKRRSTLAAAILFTAPGIPMIFQGQEMLETHDFGFLSGPATDFNRATDPQHKGIVQLYHDLIALRLNKAGQTEGLTRQFTRVFHNDGGNKTLAYYRADHEGAQDAVVVVANFSHVPMPSLHIGFPQGGTWHVRFNSGANVYDSSFTNGDSFDTTANPDGADNLNFSGNIGIGPYSVVILSQ